jgi:hypothetical protein
MDKKMSIDKKILKEIAKYNKINQYILEQEALDAPPPPAPPVGDVPPPPAPDAAGGAAPTPVDVANDPDVEKLGAEGTENKEEGEGTDELDVTELVDSQKNIEQKQDEYFNNLFGQLESLQSKLGEMDSIINKLNDIEAKIEKYRQKTPEEKLELRSLDSYPFNQKLTDFFEDKEPEMEETGKEYTLTTDEVEDFQPNEIKDSFNVFNPQDIKMRNK